MRSDALLFLHVLAGMVLVGGLLATAVAAFAARGRRDDRGVLLRSVAWHGALAAVLATLVTVGLGEGLDAKEDLSGTWLDVSRALATFGLLVGGVVLAALARSARTRPALTNAVSWLALALVLIALAVAFVMAAKPS